MLTSVTLEHQHLQRQHERTTDRMVGIGKVSASFQACQSRVRCSTCLRWELAESV